MHELSLMETVRELALEQARVHDARRIDLIRLRIGSLAGVDPEALRFAFEVVMAGSLAMAARLEIEIVPARWFCSPCQRPFDAELGACLCPGCGTVCSRLLQGRELELVALDIS